MSVPTTDNVKQSTDDHQQSALNTLEQEEKIIPRSDGPIVPGELDRTATFEHHNENENETQNDEKWIVSMSRARCFALVITVTGASFVNILSLQSAVLLLPSISHDLNIPESRQQWIISSYTLTFGCFLLLWGRIADIYGKRFIFILGSAFVIPVTAVNPILPNEIAFTIFRALQGLGAAANVPTAIGILGVTFPPGKAKNYAFSAYASGAPLGAVFGNILAGSVATYASWKWVFWVLSILAVIVTIAGVVFIPISPATTGDRGISLLKSVDWIGGALITIGLIIFLFALTEGNIVGWSTIWIYLLFIIAFLLIGIFVAWQWYQEKHTNRAPLMKVSIFRNGLFSTAMIIMGVSFAIMNDWSVFATFLWQDYQNQDPVETMLRFLPGSICGVVVAIIVAHLISRVPAYMILMLGEFSLCLASLLMAIPIPPHTSYFAYGFPAMILAVVGADTAWPCFTLFTSKSLPKEDQALGGALVNASGQIGRSIGLAISTAVQTAVMARARNVPIEDAGKIEPWDSASLKGVRAAQWFNFGLGVCCLVLCGVAFRATGIVGNIPDQQQRGGGEEGIMNEEDTRRPSDV